MQRGGQQPVEVEIDTTVAHPARVLNYLAGGAGNFAADRQAVEHVAEALPAGIETARAAVRSMAAFQARVVRWLIGEVGIRQFLKVGTGVPAGEDVHEIAQAAAPEARVVYVGSDPVVLAHAHALRRGSLEGATAYVHATLQALEMIVHEASATLDLARPVAVLLPATLNFVPDDDDPDGVVARLVEAVASGSHLMIAHTSYDITAEGMVEAAERFSELLGEPYVVRGRDEIARFLDGLDVVEPGLVPIDQWRPADDVPAPPSGRPVPIYGAVGRKP
jgi:hypothetical protein